MFERLGTPIPDKRYVLLPANHVFWVQLRGKTIAEVLGWLDRYLGAVP